MRDQHPDDQIGSPRHPGREGQGHRHHRKPKAESRAGETVAIDLKSEAGHGGHCQVEGRSTDGVKLDIVGRSVTPLNDPRGISDSDLDERLDVLSWSASNETTDITHKDARAEQTNRSKRTLCAR